MKEETEKDKEVGSGRREKDRGPYLGRGSEGKNTDYKEKP